MELVISIRQAARFVRRGGSALEALTSLAVSHDNSTPNYSKLNVSFKAPAVSIARYRSAVKALITRLQRRPRLVIHSAVIAAILLIVVVGGLNAQEGTSVPVASQVSDPVSNLVEDSGRGGLADETASAYIAAGVANEVELPLAEQVAKDVQNLNSQAIQTQVAAEDSYLQKPQVLSTQGNIRDIRKHVVAAGDSVASIAQKFNLTTNTVRWSNNLGGSTEPRVGQELLILPVNGVLHTVAATDTPEGLALIYQTTADQIVSFNDAEVSGLKPNTTVVIPGGVIVAQPATPAPTFVASSSSYVTATAFRPAYGGNGYDYGWCTWHAANRRAAAGKPIPSNWGNAISWRYNAASSGYKVGNAPQAGAVVYHNNIGGWGHVAYVERVTDDGAWFSDMNYPIWGGVTQRFVPASEFGSYSFIY